MTPDDVGTAPPDGRGGLRLQGLRKRFVDVEAVRGVDLDVPTGKLVSFLGPSGCGKTTLLRMIAGLERPTEGRIFLDGEDITDRPPHTRDIGMVFQTLALFPHLSVAGNIGYAMRIRGTPKDRARRRVDELLSLVSLEGLGDRRVSQLSGGQRQRVATARALALEPRLFLLDEPLSALDANLREQLQVELRLLQQKLQITTIMVTHDQREAMTMSDLVVVMRDGVVEQVGEALDVYRHPATAFVARFVGSSNLLRGTAVASDRIRLGSHDLRVGGTELTVGDDVTVSLRPEEAHLTLGDRPPDRDNVLGGTVVFMRDLGELFECYVDVGLEDPLIVAGSPRERVDARPGDRASVAFAPDACIVVAPEVP